MTWSCWQRLGRQVSEIHLCHVQDADKITLKAIDRNFSGLPAGRYDKPGSEVSDLCKQGYLVMFLILLRNTHLQHV
jgi:hypothetical protein